MNHEPKRETKPFKTQYKKIQNYIVDKILRRTFNCPRTDFSTIVLKGKKKKSFMVVLKKRFRF